MIAAMSRNEVIGKDNKLVWDIPEDMKRFRDMTRGHTVVMGRKTYESIGKLLPKRENIIMTGDKDFKVEGATIFHDFESCLRHISFIKEDVFIIGGQKIYELFLPVADMIDLTTIWDEYDGDTFFPPLDRKNVWNTIEISTGTSANGPDYIFETLKFNSERDWNVILDQLS